MHTDIYFGYLRGETCLGLSNFRSDDDISFDPMKIARL